MAIVRSVGGRSRVEFPVGKVLYESRAYITDLRISPDGEFVAFLDHPVSMGDDAGSVVVLTRAGSKVWASDLLYVTGGLAWASDGEVWFSAMEFGSETGWNKALYSAKPRRKDSFASQNVRAR